MSDWPAPDPGIAEAARLQAEQWWWDDFDSALDDDDEVIRDEC